MRASPPIRGLATGPDPTNRGKPGTKRHLISGRAGTGIPLAHCLTAANAHDSTLFEPLLDAIPPIKQPRGRPRKRPAKLRADTAYEIRRSRQALTARRITVRIAR